MDKSRTKIARLSDHENDNYVPGTPAERVALVWELTKELASLSKLYDAKKGLQRHITRVIRGRS